MAHDDDQSADPILGLAGMRDPVGVLTVTLGLRTGSRSDAFPGRRLVRAALDDLDDTEPSPAGDMAAACRRRREEIMERVEEMCDGRQTGRGRVLVVPLTGPAQQLNLWDDVPDDITLSTHAHVSPLLGLREQGRPVGLVAVSQAHVVVAERANGVLRPVGTFGLGDEGLQDASQDSVQHQETERHLKSRAFERRVTRHRKDVLAAHANEIAHLATSGGWWAVAICGDPDLIESIRTRVAVAGIEVIVSSVIPRDGWTLPDLEQALRPDLDDAARARREHAAAHALSAAQARGGTAAVGVDDVLDALTKGRVHHLIVAPHALPTTYEQTPDGRLSAEGEYPAGVLHGRMRRLPGLCDRMVAEAVRHGAQLTALAADESAGLTAAGGVVALLRG